MDNMVPMFEPVKFEGSKREKKGKHSFTDGQRVEIFKFVIDEIRKHSGCTIATAFKTF